MHIESGSGMGTEFAVHFILFFSADEDLDRSGAVLSRIIIMRHLLFPHRNEWWVKKLTTEDHSGSAADPLLYQLLIINQKA
jgi:hypothetical protein